MALKNILFITVILLFATNTFAQEKVEKKSRVQFVQSTSERITKEPQGSKIGTAFVNAPVQVLESQGRWVKVVFTGWVRRNVVGGKFVSDPQGKKRDRKLFIQTGNQVLWSDPSGRRYASPARGVEINLNSDAGAWVNISFEGWVRSDSIGDDIVEPTAAKDPLTIESFETRTIDKSDDIGPPRVIVELTLKNNSKYPIEAWNGILTIRDTQNEPIVTNRVKDEKANIPVNGTVKASYYWASGDAPYLKLLKREKSDLIVELLKVEID